MNPDAAASGRPSAARPPRELLDALYRYDSAIQSLALGLRRAVHAELAPCHEYIFEMRGKVVLLYSATSRVIADGICLIGVHRRHVTLGFRRGTDLRDPKGLLRGAGKRMRHVRLAALADLDRTGIRSYLRQARRLAGLPRRRDGAAVDVVTRVKAASQPKRPIWPRVR